MKMSFHAILARLAFVDFLISFEEYGNGGLNITSQKIRSGRILLRRKRVTRNLFTYTHVA